MQNDNNIKKKWLRFSIYSFIALTLLLVQTNPVFSKNINNTSLKDQRWYRYYDHKGVANISSSITQSHIQYGYETLDQNMQIIKKNDAFNAEKNQKSNILLSTDAQEIKDDLLLKKAYGTSEVAKEKKKMSLDTINNQINFQLNQLKNLQQNRIHLKKIEMEYIRKNQLIPHESIDKLEFNSKNIEQTINNIQMLQQNYMQTEIQFNKIIDRLKLKP